MDNNDNLVAARVEADSLRNAFLFGWTEGISKALHQEVDQQ
jgi:hypothetical protein